jgi:hypothetical protein
MRLMERIFQIAVFGVAIFMVWGGGFFHREGLAYDLTRTLTYTLYRSLPPWPAGPRFCQILSVDDYGLVMPCDGKPPFLWWVRHKLG